MTDTTNATTDNPEQGQPQQGDATQAPGGNPLSSFAANTATQPNPLNNANAPAPAENADPLAWLPEKFRTKGVDGVAVDYEASARKIAESYAHLEKRNGSGELAPADIAGYKLADGMPDINEMVKHDDFKEFLTNAHKAGVNNTQLSLMVGEVIKQSEIARNEAAGLSNKLTGEQAETELRKVWDTPEAYNQNMASALAAVRAIFKDPSEQQAVFNDYGTDPRMIRMMATLGREVGEDRMSFIGQPEITAEDVDTLMRSPAYQDEKHADHKAVRAKVKAHFERTAGSARVV